MTAWGPMTTGRTARWVLAALTAVAVVLAGVVPAEAATYVYVTSLAENQVFQLGVGGGGALSPLTPPAVAVNDISSGVAVSPNGRRVYVTTFAGVAQFDLGQGGLHTPMTPAAVPISGGAGSVAASPDRRSVYVVSTRGAIFSSPSEPMGRCPPSTPRASS
jgi:DNA-binding beta-propeller fold protein YncE